MTKVKEMLEALEKDLRDKRQYSAADKLLPIIAEAGKEKEAILKQLEALKMRYFLTIANTGEEKMDFAYEKVGDAIDKAIEIVKNGGK